MLQTFEEPPYPPYKLNLSKIWTTKVDHSELKVIAFVSD